MKTKNLGRVRLEFARSRAPARMPRGSAALRCSLCELKKVLTALEFSELLAVLNSRKGARQTDGEKILRWDIKWADKIGTNFKVSGWPEVVSGQHLKT